MSLIFHFETKGLFEDYEEHTIMTEIFRDAFFVLLKVLVRSSVSFSIVFHGCKDPDSLQKLLNEKLNAKVPIDRLENCLATGFDVLTKARSSKTRGIWIIEKESLKSKHILDGVCPGLSFSWFFRAYEKNISILNKEGCVIQKDNLPEMIHLNTEFCNGFRSKLSLLMEVRHRGLDSHGLGRYIRPLEKTDIGKKITKLVLTYHPRFYNSTFSDNRDCSYCFPECYVLEDIEFKSLENICNSCGKNTNKMCGKCKNTYYCDKCCQTIDLPHHKLKCDPNKPVAKKVTFMCVRKIDPWRKEEVEVVKKFYLDGWGVTSEIPLLGEYCDFLFEITNCITGDKDI